MAAADSAPVSSQPSALVLKAREKTGAAGPVAVSVIIAYEDLRAKAEHVRTWTEGQTMPGDQYEVIVVTDGAHPRVEAEIARYLRPQDVLVCSPGTERFLLCNVGADAARSDTFFFTEDHCLAEAGGVALAARVLKDQKSECVTLGWGNINDSYVGLFEERVTMQNMDIWHGPDHWNTLRARGFVITRRAFERAGRFPAGYGIFAEALFTARLHESGVRTGYTPEVGVRHINSESLADLAGNAWHYSHFECLAATRCEAEFFDRYFDRSQVLLSDHIPPEDARLARGLIYREWMREAFPKKTRSRRWKRIAAWSALYAKAAACQHGGTLMRAASWLSMKWKAAACQWWRFHDSRRFSTFGKWWRAVVHHARVDFLGKAQGQRAHLANRPGTYAGASLRLLHGWGLHGTDTVGGQSMRWTGTMAIIPFQLPAGQCEITIDSGGFRGGDCHFPFVLYWNRQRVSRRDLNHTGPKVTFQVKSRGEQSIQRLIVLVPQTLQTQADPRALGFPLAGLTLTASSPEQQPALTGMTTTGEFVPLSSS
jgi:hypothetical protein